MNSMNDARWRSGRSAIVVAVAAVLALCAVGFAYWTFTVAEAAATAHSEKEQDLVKAKADRDSAQTALDERKAAAEEAARIEAQERAEREAKDLQDQVYADAGFENVGSDVYFAWADSSNFTCGRYDCIAFAVVAAEGCPGGMYLEAAIMRGGTQVAWTNETFSGLGKGDSASGFFDDIYGQGDSFRLTEVNCR